MRFSQRIFLLIVWALVIGLKGVYASGTTGAEFLRTEVPAQAAAVAAGVAGSHASEGLAWNPASLQLTGVPAVAFTHFASLVDTAYEQLEGFYPNWLDGSWACRLFYASTYNFVEINDEGNENGVLENYDALLHLGYARPLGEGFSGGAAVKVFESALAGYKSHGLALDFGAGYQTPWPWLAVGATLQNLGSMSAFDAEADPLPLQALAGACVSVPVWPGSQAKLSADWHQPLAGDDKSYVAAGMEFFFQESVSLRVGYRFVDEFGQLTVGTGLHLAGLGLDYAYQPFSDLGNSHRVTFSYSFLPPQAPEPTLPAPAPVALPVQLAQPLDLSEKIEPLRLLPQQFEAQVVFHAANIGQGAGPWNLTIQDETNSVVKAYAGVGAMPQEIVWDGRNEQGEFLYGEKTFHFTWAHNGQMLQGDLPKVQPVWKLHFADSSAAWPETTFHFQVRPRLASWKLSINDGQGQPVWNLGQDGLLPEELIWDGKNTKAEIAPSGQVYQYGLDASYDSQHWVRILERIKPVEARCVAAGPGQTGILLLGILFDVDRAELKPEMAIKLLAAARILQRRGSQATACCEGHADETGTQAHNQVLSEQRAKMTAKALSEQPGILAGQLSTLGFGTTRPENMQGDEAGRAQNRRVEIRLAFPAQ